MPDFRLRKFEVARIREQLRRIRSAALVLVDTKVETKRREAFSELDQALFSCGDALSVLEGKDGL